MTEQELREKIARIIAKHLCKNRYSHFQLYGDSANCYSRENFAECEAVCNAVDDLIAEEIGDVKKAKLESDHFWRMWQGALVELERAEHRAEVAEKMYLMMRDCNVEKRKCGVPSNINCLVDDDDCAKCMDIYYLLEAEKELQEENKDVR